jgi:hydroxymethylpyrimidine pyrophosphatase-like HAD family hydrolase
VARRTIQLARKYGHCSQYYVGDEILADPIIITQQQDTLSTLSPSTTTTTTSYYRSHLQLTQLYKDLTGAQTVYLPHDENFENFCIDKGLPSKQLVLFPPLLQDEMMAVFEREMKQDDLIAASTATLDDNDNNTTSTTLKSAATIVRGNLGWFLEILHPSVCKGLGLQRLVREHLSGTDKNNNMMDMEDCIAFGDGDNDVEFLQMAGLGIVMLNGRKVAKQVADCITTKCHDMNGVVTTLQLLEEYGKLHFPKKPSSPSKSSLLPAKTASSTEATSLSTASLSSTSTSSLSNNSVVTAAAIQVDDNNNENNTDTTLDSSCNSNRQERCDTVEF